MATVSLQIKINKQLTVTGSLIRATRGQGEVVIPVELGEIKGAGYPNALASGEIRLGDKGSSCQRNYHGMGERP